MMQNINVVGRRTVVRQQASRTRGVLELVAELFSVVMEEKVTTKQAGAVMAICFGLILCMFTFSAYWAVGMCGLVSMVIGSLILKG